jgi:hypothetical protein
MLPSSCLISKREIRIGQVIRVDRSIGDARYAWTGTVIDRAEDHTAIKIITKSGEVEYLSIEDTGNVVNRVSLA